MELGIQGWGVVCWLRQPLWATDGSSLGAGEVCIYTFPWKEGTQLPVRLLVSAAAPVASGSPPSCGSDGCWGLGHLLQPLPDHQPEHGVPGDRHSCGGQQAPTHTPTAWVPGAACRSLCFYHRPSHQPLCGFCSFPHPMRGTEQTKSKPGDLTIARNSGKKRMGGRESSSNRKGSECSLCPRHHQSSTGPSPALDHLTWPSFDHSEGPTRTAASYASS